MTDFETSALLWIAQATLVLCLGLIGSLLLRRRAAAAHASVLVALLLVVLLPGLSWAMRQTGAGLLPAKAAPVAFVEQAPVLVTPGPAQVIAPARPAPAAPPPPITAATADPKETLTLSRTAWIGLAWGTLSAAVLLRLVRGFILGARLHRTSVRCEDPALLEIFARALRDVEITRRVELHRSRFASCPMICCWGVPRVLLPEHMPAGVDQRAVFVHELAHLARRDHLSSLLAELVCCILPWHPLAWSARRRLAALAEQACDDWALRHATSEVEYADALVSFAVPRGATPLSLAIVSPAGVRARVARILSSRRGPARLGRAAAAAVLLGAIGAGMLASLAQPAAPVAPIQAEEVGDDPIESFLAHWRRNAAAPNRGELWRRARAIAELDDPRMIPALIGIIDADNSYDTIYGVGYFGLSKITGVAYSPYHDGAWWRRWWEANRERFPGAAGEAIPDLPRSRAAAQHVPFPEDLDTFEGKIRWLLKDLDRLREGKLGTLGLSAIAGEIAKHEDPRAIPTLIGVIDSDNSYETVYGLGHFGLGKITGVAYSPYHDGPWWRRWWEANKSNFPPAAQAIPIPELPKTAQGRAYVPMPESFDTFEGKIEWLLGALAAGGDVSYGS